MHLVFCAVFLLIAVVLGSYGKFLLRKSLLYWQQRTDKQEKYAQRVT